MRPPCTPVRWHQVHKDVRFSSSSPPPAERNFRWWGCTSWRSHTGEVQVKASRRYTWAYLTFVNIAGAHTAKKCRHRNSKKSPACCLRKSFSRQRNSTSVSRSSRKRRRTARSRPRCGRPKFGRPKLGWVRLHCGDVRRGEFLGFREFSRRAGGSSVEWHEAVPACLTWRALGERSPEESA